MTIPDPYTTPSHISKTAPLTSLGDFNFFVSRSIHLAPKFGARLSEWFESSPKRVEERLEESLEETLEETLGHPTSNYTSAAEIWISSNGTHDGVVKIEVGNADEVAKTLFPHFSQVAHTFSPSPSSKTHCHSSTDSTFLTETPTGIHDLSPIWSGAALSFVESDLREVWQGFETCQLRRWEKNQHEMYGYGAQTGCITLHVNAGNSQTGTIYVRLSAYCCRDLVNAWCQRSLNALSAQGVGLGESEALWQRS